MTREEAKAWMTVPEHTLRIIAPCIYFNPDVLKLFHGVLQLYVSVFHMS